MTTREFADRLGESAIKSSVSASMNHDVPDRAPDGQARREPIPIYGYPPFSSATPCPDCGRSAKTHLTLAEAKERYGYGRTDCLACLLSQTRRPKC